VSLRISNFKEVKKKKKSLKGEIDSKVKFMERNYKKRRVLIVLSMRKNNYFE
jgi:hypothetical protein